MLILVHNLCDPSSCRNAKLFGLDLIAARGEGTSKSVNNWVSMLFALRNDADKFVSLAARRVGVYPQVGSNLEQALGVFDYKG